LKKKKNRLPKTKQVSEGKEKDQIQKREIPPLMRIMITLRIQGATPPLILKAIKNHLLERMSLMIRVVTKI
jgi:hypothetical protein